MIIKLDNSLISYCKLNSGTPSHIAFFELFAEIKLRGFHFILAERNLLQTLGNLSELSERTRSTYRKLFQNYTTEKSIENSVEFSLNISSHKSQRIDNTTSNIYIDELDLNSFLSRNKLLLENTADTDIYTRITDFYRVNNGMSNINFQWEPSNGGGSTTFSEFQRILNERLTYTYCIIDSDKISPHSTLGSTANIFKKKPKNSAFGNHFILETHEMENLYPPELLVGMCAGIGALKKNYNNIESMNRDKECSSFLYLDLKNGLSTYSLSQMNDDSKRYWEDILSKNKIAYQKCSCTTKKCNHFIIYPFGRKIGEDIISFIKNISLSIVDLLSDKYKKIWNIIGKVLFDRFCCPKFTVAI